LRKTFLGSSFKFLKGKTLHLIRVKHPGKSSSKNTLYLRSVSRNSFLAIRAKGMNEKPIQV
jgi:hypothetical protein